MYGLWVVIQNKRMKVEIPDYPSLLELYSGHDILDFVNRHIKLAEQARIRQTLRDFFDEGREDD